MSGATLDNLSTESRSFPPPEGFAEQASRVDNMRSGHRDDVLSRVL